MITDDAICEAEERSKANEVLGQCIEAFQGANLRTQDLVVVWGNLGYSLGASIEGFTESGPSLEELQQAYHQNPTIGIAMMLQGMMATLWSNQMTETFKKEQEGK